MRSRVERTSLGITYVEVMATVAVMLILALMIMPVARAGRRKAKELELRAALRTMRDAIDEFHARCETTIIVGDGQKVAKKPGDGTCADPTWPDKLEDLVEGVPILPDGSKKLKLLRRIPTDPMNDNKADWGFRCYKDRFDAQSWCGTDIYDVYSKSSTVGSDGRKYSEW